MRWKSLIICTLFIGSMLAFTARAAEPMTYREIAMLVRNGEDPQFIVNDTAKRKLLQPLTKDEEEDLASMGASQGLLAALRAPAMMATQQEAAAYASHAQQQKLMARSQEQQDRLLAERQEAAAEAIQKPQGAGAAAAKPPAAQAGDGDFMGKPLALKFTAADGSPVDIADLRGKVVLIDFWATWCEPCMKEVPAVVAAYKKYHDQGFEIIGVSLDQNKYAMRKMAAEKEMTWPQYFDGKGWDNAVSSAFHIRSIPTMWLVNKNGVIVYPNAQADLDGSIAKLLAQ